MTDMTLLAHRFYLKEVERLAQCRRQLRAGPVAVLACLALVSGLALLA
jgi:hypothetical protein